MTPERLHNSLCPCVVYRILAAATIGNIANNWMTDVRQVHANLMGAARFDLDVEQGEIRKASGNFEDCMSGPTCVSSKDAHPSATARTAADAGFDFTLLIRDAAINQRNVELEHLAISKLIR